MNKEAYLLADNEKAYVVHSPTDSALLDIALLHSLQPVHFLFQPVCALSLQWQNSLIM